MTAIHGCSAYRICGCEKEKHFHFPCQFFAPKTHNPVFVQEGRFEFDRLLLISTEPVPTTGACHIFGFNEF